MATIDESQHFHKGMAHKEKKGQTGSKLWKLITNRRTLCMRGQQRESIQYLETMVVFCHLL